jgi:hypothetical protein
LHYAAQQQNALARCDCEAHIRALKTSFGWDQMDRLQLLQERAERCYRLAGSITDDFARAGLRSLAKETETAIAALEAEQASRYRVLRQVETWTDFRMAWDF